MIDDLEKEYPEAAPYILDAVEEHGEEWVIENYFPKIAQLGVVMDIPSVEELPFYDDEIHDVRGEEQRKHAEALGAYLKNLRTGYKPSKD